MRNNSLGERMKMYEQIGASAAQLIPTLPAIVRLDGKAFHTFTRDLPRPYCKQLSDMMVDTTKFLVELSSARIGYTQSDEITLVLEATTWREQIYFDGITAKLNSILAAYAAMYFNRILPRFLPHLANQLPDMAPVFDCRCFNVPSRDEAINCLIWREQDAVRNSIQMAGQAKFSPHKLEGKSCEEIQEMLFQQHGINWNEYPAFFKRGTYVRRAAVVRPFKFKHGHLNKLPEKHRARTDSNLTVTRYEMQVIDLPILTKITNREQVLFGGMPPLVDEVPATGTELTKQEA
jgi:tRNA(His) guanylyltransferase